MNFCLSLKHAACILVILTGGLSGQLIAHRDSLLFSPTQRTDTLSYAPAFEGSWDIIDEHGNILDTSLIDLEIISGIIRWKAPLNQPRNVIIRYRTLADPVPMELGPAWQYLPTLEQVVDDSAGIPVGMSASSIPAQVRRPETGERLVTAGSLFRGLTVTSQHGVNLTGGLNLQLQGELGKGVFITGSLTDKNLPIQLEGDTRTLNELDQIRLMASGSWGGVEVGDFMLKGPEGHFTEFERKLEGMRVQLRGPKWEAESVIAGSPGRFRSQSFQGEDGRQGPYALTTHEGSRTLIILPGTETVWLNGIRLERGDGLDYTIDYSAGEIRFTPRHTIRSDSRIVVDFEYTDLVYTRTTGYLATRWHGDRSSLKVTALTERDHLESNLEFSLSAEDQKYLRGIGDREQDAVVSTAVVDTTGGYDLEDEHYIWRGRAQGEYRVSFHNVGETGNYRRVVAGDSLLYEWVPVEERGRYNTVYAPFRLLKLPQLQDQFMADWTLSGKREDRYARMEVGFSRVDQNRFSPLDDDDNLDLGYAIQMHWKSMPVTLVRRTFRTGIQVDALGKGSRFQPPGRWDAVEFQRDWDLDDHPEGYHWQTAGLVVDALEGLQARAQLGHLQADSIETGRLRWGISREGKKSLMGRLWQTHVFRMNGKRTWDITDSELKYSFNKCAPFVRYYAEDKHRGLPADYQVQQVLLGVETNLAAVGQVTLSRERRRDTFRSGLSETAHRWLVTLKRASLRGTRLETTFSFNEKRTSDEREDLSYLMGNFSVVHRPREKPWWIDMRYLLERSIHETKAVIYDSVGTGLGEYRYDPTYDIYVPDEAGVYLRYAIPAGEIRPVYTVKSQFRLQADLHRIHRSFNPMEGFAEARLIIQGQLGLETEEHSVSTYLKPGLEDTTLGNVQSRLRLDLALQSKPRQPQYRLRLLKQVKLTREEVGRQGGTDRFGEGQDQVSADLRRISQLSLAGRTLNLELRLLSERKTRESLVSLMRNHDILKWSGGGTIAGTVGDRSTLSLMSTWQSEIDYSLDDFQVRTVSYGAGIQRPVRAKGRLRLDLERFHVVPSRSISIPYIMAEGFPSGVSFRLRGNAQFQLSSNLLLNVSLFSRQEAGRDTFTSANLELRTQF